MKDSFESLAEWRRLHPLTLVYRGVMNLPGLAIPLYFAFIQKDASEIIYITIFLVFGLLAFPSIVLAYYFFEFLVTPKEIVIKSGVFNRQTRSIPIRRVQNIEINQNFLHKILGLARVNIETAGDVETEGALEYVSKNDAEDVRRVIRTYQNKIEEENVDPSDIEPAILDEDSPEERDRKNEKAPDIEGKPLFKLSLKDALVFGALRFRPLVFMLVFWAFAVAQQFAFFPAFGGFDISDHLSSLFNQSVSTIALTIILVLMAASFLSWIFDILLTLNAFYGFVLTKDGNKLLTKQGFFNTRRGAIPLKMLQIVHLTTNLIRRKLGFWGVTIETAGFGANMKRPEVAVPFARKVRVVALARDILPFEYPGEFRKVSKKTIRRAMVRYSIPFLFILAAAYFWFDWAYWALALYPAAYFMARLSYLYRGYWLSDEAVIIKSGYFFTKISIIPIRKIQTLNISESFFQRRLRLASLNVDVAATFSFADAEIIDLDAEEARELLEEIAERFRNLKQSGN